MICTLSIIAAMVLLAAEPRSAGARPPRDADPDAPTPTSSFERALNDFEGCVDVSWTEPDGTIVVTVDCSERDAARQLFEFMYRSWQAEYAPNASLREQVPKPNPRLERAIRKIEQGDDLGDLLISPPATFGQRSQQLAAQIREVIETSGKIKVLLVGSVFLDLATDHPLEAVAKHATHMGELVEAVLSMDSIMKGKIRQLIMLELAKQPPVFSAKEGEWWETLHGALR